MKERYPALDDIDEYTSIEEIIDNQGSLGLENDDIEFIRKRLSRIKDNQTLRDELDVSGFLEDRVMDEIAQMYNEQADQNAFLKAGMAYMEADQASKGMEGGTMDETYSPPPTKPKYTEHQLTMMPDWIEVSKRMHRVMEGYEFIGSDKQAAAYGLDLVSEFNWNAMRPAALPW